MTAVASERTTDPIKTLTRDMQAASLADLVDAVSQKTGGWVVVERFGDVLAHGAGSRPCPAPLAEALLSKRMAALRHEVSWVRGPDPMRGTVSGIRVTSFAADAGVAVWHIGDDGADGGDQWATVLAAAAGDQAQPVTDQLIASMLHPRSSVGGPRAPATVLVALTSTERIAVLSRAALTATVGGGGRVHADADVVFVALRPDLEAQDLAQRVRERCPDVVAGVVEVPDGAVDWTAAARLARAAAQAAERLHLEIGFVSAPAIAAEMVIQEAQRAAVALACTFGGTPLDRLYEHDRRTSGALVPTVRAWCRAGCDATTAAAALYVHTNTLRYRLRRASQISGLDLREPRHLLAMQLLLG